MQYNFKVVFLVKLMFQAVKVFLRKYYRNRKSVCDTCRLQTETFSLKYCIPFPLPIANRKQANLSAIQANLSAIQANQSAI